MESIPQQALTVDGETSTLDVGPHFADPDGDRLAYAAVSGDIGVVAASVSASSLTLTPVSRGSATVMVRATDPGGLAATQLIAVTVPDLEVGTPSVDETGATMKLAFSPLTATLTQVRSTTDRSGAVRYGMYLDLSEPTAISWRTMRDHVFTVTGGTVVAAKRCWKRTEVIDGRARSVTSSWRLDIKPERHRANVTVILPANRACSTTGAICTPDGRMLSQRATLTLKPGRPDLTVSIADATANEDDGVMLFEVTLSKSSIHPVTLLARTTIRGTATADVDFGSSGEVMLLCKPGTTSQKMGVALMADEIDDDGETIVVEITGAREVSTMSVWSNPVTIADGEAIRTIRDTG